MTNILTIRYNFMRLSLFIALLFWTQALIGQSDKGNTNTLLGVNFSFGFHLPAGDLADRYGTNTNVNLGTDLITEKNMIFGFDLGFMFGSKVKEDIFSNIRSGDEQLIGNTRLLADVQLRMRGFYVGGHFGKLFPILSNNKRSGIRASIGVGLLQHRIRIQQDPQSFVVQLGGDYSKGYDRLSNGLAITEFIGYQHFSKNRLVNLFAGFEFRQGFTKSRRSFNFDEMRKDDQSRTDLQIGFKVGLTLPFYIGDNPDDFYY